MLWAGDVRAVTVMGHTNDDGIRPLQHVSGHVRIGDRLQSHTCSLLASAMRDCRRQLCSAVGRRVERDENVGWALSLTAPHCVGRQHQQ